MNVPDNAFFRKRIFKPFRITLGSVLVFFGIFGFLPIVGFWMIPAGIAVLSIDVPWAKRVWDRIELWYLNVLDRGRKRFPKLPWSKIPVPEREERTPSEPEDPASCPRSS